MFFIKTEYPINEKVDDILNRLEKDMRVIEEFNSEKIRVIYQSRRNGNTIEVSHQVINDKYPEPLTGLSFSFEAERVTDARSVIIGKYQDENTHIEKLYFTYLSRLGVALDAPFKESAVQALNEAEAKIEKERGAHWDWTDWREIGGIKIRSYALVPNDSRPANAEHKDVTLRELKERFNAGDKQAATQIKKLAERVFDAIGKPALDERNKLLSDPYGKIILPWLESQMNSENPLLRLSAEEYSLANIENMIKNYPAEAIKDITQPAQSANFNETPYELKNLNCTYKEFIEWVKEKYPKAKFSEKGNTFELCLLPTVFDSNYPPIDWPFFEFEVTGHNPLSLQGAYYYLVKDTESKDFVDLANNYFMVKQAAQYDAGKPEDKQIALQAKWDKMIKKTKDYFRKAWNIWLKMQSEYEQEALDGQTKKAKPEIKDWRTRVIDELRWQVDTDRLRDVKEMGDAGIIK